MFSNYFGVAVQLIRAWRKGGRFVRKTLAVAIALTLIAILVVALGEADVLNKSVTGPVGAGIGAVAALLGIGVYARQQAVDYSEREQKIEQVERRFHENPTEPQAAWELARVKLETYLNRNLNQVRSIFWLTSIVMVVGFILIGYGVSKAFDSPQAIGPAVVAAGSGILVNLIGATFLVIYRSTMEQAKEYVAILERINAVGMAVQILESLGDRDHALRQETTAQIATQLLTLYAAKPPA
ncbi:MAG TPA: hypothetical protein VF584_22505 [Longimicrobium sp.]|jgi:hypothetical protein